jgi:hypothetical protein
LIVFTPSITFFMLILVSYFPLVHNYVQILFYYCAGWGYIVAVTKVLKIYQMYHTCVHSLYYSPSFPPPPSIPWNNFHRLSVFFLHTNVHRICTIVTFRHHFSTSFPLLPKPTLPDRTCSTLLSSNFV